MKFLYFRSLLLEGLYITFYSVKICEQCTINHFHLNAVFFSVEIFGTSFLQAFPQFLLERGFLCLCKINDFAWQLTGISRRRNCLLKNDARSLINKRKKVFHEQQTQVFCLPPSYVHKNTEIVIKEKFLSDSHPYNSLLY